MAILGKITIQLCDRIIHNVHDKHHPDIQTSYDILYNTSEIVFERGKIYGILCKCGEGGQGITNLLTGNDYIDKEKIHIDGKLYKKGEKISEGWEMGKGFKNLFLYNKTVKQQIEHALKKSKKNMTVDDIVKKFELTPERLGCKIFNLSGERWRASAAIGYAYGKKIFCFPWLDNVTLENVITTGYALLYADILRKEDNIIIVPTAEREILEYITDEIIELRNPQFHNNQSVLKYLKQHDFLNKFSDK